MLPAWRTIFGQSRPTSISVPHATRRATGIACTPRNSSRSRRSSPGQRVLDAGAGTGFATLAIARRVGPAGRVLAVDVSAGMLAELRAAATAAGLSHVDALQGDATRLEALATESFDAVLCSSALLYMSAPDALREWHRLLKPHGLVGFSTMCADSPLPGRMFRDCATSFGLTLEDPSAVLGSEERCWQGDARRRIHHITCRQVKSTSPRQISRAPGSPTCDPRHMRLSVRSRSRIRMFSVHATRRRWSAR